MGKELDLNGKIRNLQVSISIYKREAKEILEHWDRMDEVTKVKKRYRLEVIQASIAKKEKELIQLKEEKIHKMQAHNIVIPELPNLSLTDLVLRNADDNQSTPSFVSPMKHVLKDLNVPMDNV